MERSIINNPHWIVVIHALIQFDALERLCSLGQAALTSELDELHKAMDADYATFTSPHDEDGYLSHVNDEYIEVTETLPCLYWYAQLLIAYSFFERSLDAVCFSLQKEKKASLSLKDIAGQGIIRSKTYLKKVFNIETPFQTSDWQSATLFAEIRNVIAHRNGYLDRETEEINSLFNRLDQRGIELKSEIQDQEDAQIIVKRELVLESIAVYKNIIKDVGSLPRNFITPKHGLPTYTNNEK